MDATQYKSLIESLTYLTTIRPNIVFGVKLFSIFMKQPCDNHLQGVKRILRYIKCTLIDGNFYAINNDV
uniref:Retrovirus-related Pol polyprotein from transposon TNT 1-94 n=1 Tax=Cajanus cajan TaxID=3821 RepID=A0A151UB87_CAJCA|nr:hypothetical protein KK1_020785 [Cajanus cajan]